MEPGWKIRPETFFFGLPTRPETGMETGMKLGWKSGLVGLPKNRVPEPKKLILHKKIGKIMQINKKLEWPGWQPG